MKRFNVTGVCVPEKDYMVNTEKKLRQMIALIEDGQYFTMNRARQYGKTTTLASLFRELKEAYTVIRISFEGMGEESFTSSNAFVRAFVKKVGNFLPFTGETEQVIRQWCEMEEQIEEDVFSYLSKKITRLCESSRKEVLLFVDEVDKSSDNQIFLNFLGMLRSKYLDAKEGFDLTFKSVILAGVYDIKNLKLRLRPNEERKYNSPWNIAADFNVDMSFSPEEIATMLQEYEEEHNSHMDIMQISKELYFYTGGYPYLVSRLCKWIDEEGGRNWSPESVKAAEKELLKTRNTLFDDLIKNVENNRDLKDMLTNILYNGREYSYHLSNPVISLGVMFGIFRERNHMTAISNVTFETYLYDYIISLEIMKKNTPRGTRSQFIENGKLNMPLVLEKFQKLMQAEYRTEDESFVEQQGRLLFLCFLKPIINGTGFYYVEPETRDDTRMDLVVTYGGEEHIIELKIWHGQKYRKRGIRQLEEYMEHREAKTGYLISFSFIKNKKHVNDWLSEEETTKKIYEVII